MSDQQQQRHMSDQQQRHSFEQHQHVFDQHQQQRHMSDQQQQSHMSDQQQRHMFDEDPHERVVSLNNRRAKDSVMNRLGKKLDSNPGHSNTRDEGPFFKITLNRKIPSLLDLPPAQNNFHQQPFPNLVSLRSFPNGLRLQWGSEIRPFENWKHSKNGRFHVQFSNGSDFEWSGP